jgi:hypothetical protein
MGSKVQEIELLENLVGEGKEEATDRKTVCIICKSDTSLGLSPIIIGICVE